VTAEKVGIEALPPIEPRPMQSHKGSYGAVLIVAGSVGFTGAASLASMACLRAGAGLVTLACAESLNLVFETKLTEVITHPLAATPDGTIAAEALDPLLALHERFDAVVLGPGLGLNDDTRALARGFLKGCRKPTVVDADGLNALVGAPEVLKARGQPTVITPHPGEMGRLIDMEARQVVANAGELAAGFAREFGLVVALKKHGTIVADSRSLYVNATGNPGMATAGSGDVLAGMIGAFLGQGMDAFRATALGVYLHGMAGDLARDQVGETSLIASDILGALPAAISRYSLSSGTEKS